MLKGGTRHTGALVFGVLLAYACRGSDTNASAASVAPQPPTDECTQPSGTPGFASPQAAYTRYAESLNSARWCDAIQAFTPASRIEVLVSSFKGFLLLAGSANARQSEYAERLATFCHKYGLNYGERQRLLTLTLDLMNRYDVSAELDPLRQVASPRPESMYAEIMDTLARVNTRDSGKLVTTMDDIEVVGDTASGTAATTAGRKQTMSFVLTPNGWLLTEN